MLSKFSKVVKLTKKIPSTSNLIGFTATRSITSINKAFSIGTTHTKSILFNSASFRTFSSEADTRVSIDEVLQEEIKVEKENGQELDPDYEKVKKAILKKFQIKEEKGLGVVHLTSAFKGESILVTFDCQDEEEIQPETDEDEEEDEEAPHTQLSSGDEDDEDDEDREEEFTGINFEVAIKKSAGDVVVFNCIAADVLRVQAVRYVPAGVEKDDDKLYGGPTFDTLDDTVQEAFMHYLEDRGINEDLSYFILSFSKLKEQAEYLNMLTNLQKFVAAK